MVELSGLTAFNSFFLDVRFDGIPAIPMVLLCMRHDIRLMVLK
jgi:hypothetical protein